MAGLLPLPAVWQPHSAGLPKEPWDQCRPKGGPVIETPRIFGFAKRRKARTRRVGETPRLFGFPKEGTSYSVGVVKETRGDARTQVEPGPEKGWAAEKTGTTSKQNGS